MKSPPPQKKGPLIKMAPTLKILGVVSKFLYSGGWQVCVVVVVIVVNFLLVLLYYCSSSSLSCDGSLTLVSSKNELHSKYKVQVLASKGVSTNDTG